MLTALVLLLLLVVLLLLRSWAGFSLMSSCCSCGAQFRLLAARTY